MEHKKPKLDKAQQEDATSLIQEAKPSTIGQLSALSIDESGLCTKDQSTVGLYVKIGEAWMLVATFEQ